MYEPNTVTVRYESCPYNIYIYIYMSWVQITLNVTLNNITPLNNLLLNSCFENPTIELHVLYVLNMHAKFHVNQM